MTLEGAAASLGQAKPSHWLVGSLLAVKEGAGRGWEERQHEGHLGLCCGCLLPPFFRAAVLWDRRNHCVCWRGQLRTREKG